MFKVVFKAVICKLTENGGVGAARAIPVRVAALYHKAADYTVEGKSVIEALICKVNEVCNRHRRSFGLKLNSNCAVSLDNDIGIIFLFRINRGRYVALVFFKRCAVIHYNIVLCLAVSYNITVVFKVCYHFRNRKTLNAFIVGILFIVKSLVGVGQNYISVKLKAFYNHIIGIL